MKLKVENKHVQAGLEHEVDIMHLLQDVPAEMPFSSIYTSRFDIISQKVKSEPPEKLIWRGIKENTVGFLVGPPKCGKTTIAETLLMSIASGANDFLGDPLDILNRKALVLSLEEYYRGRTERNNKQEEFLLQNYGLDLNGNYFVANEKIPRYISEDTDWNILKYVIHELQPGIVVIDSLTRLYSGSIEDSQVAMEVMKRLRELIDGTQTALIVIHHVPKLQNQPLSIYAVAGSRVLAQEADFVIGLNKTQKGDRYIKNIAFRYAPGDDDDSVLMYRINDYQWIESLGPASENELLEANDGRRNNDNLLLILSYMIAQAENGQPIVSYDELRMNFVPKVLSKQALSSRLRQLVEAGKIKRVPGNGMYSLIKQE